ncbi:MAG TPA: hypothetical protein VMS43_05915 [Allosphingosinicella sp.]|nr:hypothetical protein [Allosphingosinicella sp.]
MSLIDTFSRRKRQRERAGSDDVYSYDTIPNPLRVQLIQIWEQALGLNRPSSHGADAIAGLVRIIRRERGVFGLCNNYELVENDEELRRWFLSEQNADFCLDCVELVCRFLQNKVSNEPWRYENRQGGAEAAIIEINARFTEAGIGYQYETAANEIVRVDSRLIHAEVVKPALSLLAEPVFAGPQKEFLDAHGHYRQGDYEQALTECGKAFESVLKIIAQRRGWSISDKATAKTLLDCVFTNGLVPEYLNGEFQALRSLLESGVPTIRNRSGGHGTGSTPRSVPPHLAAFQLHQTAAAIVLLVEADKALA